MSTSEWSSISNFTTKVTYVPSNEEAKLLATDKANSDFLGYSVAMDANGTRVVVGAYGKTVSGNGSAGALYVFTRSGSSWTQEAKITASPVGSGHYFGCAVDIDSTGTRIVAGAYQATTLGITGAGQAYIFTSTGTTWAQEKQFIASDYATNDYFGWAVCIDDAGSRAIVTARLANTSGTTDAGKAYVFSRSGTTWTQEAILSANDRTTNDYFGHSVDITSDASRAIVGSMNHPVTGSAGAGASYIYSRAGSSWTQEAILTASDKASGDAFGSSVSIASDGSRCVVGARIADPGVNNAGKAYVFTRSGTTWTQEAILTANDKAADDFFGYSIAMSGDGSKVIIAAIGADPGGLSAAGAVYIFTRSGTSWGQSSKVSASDKAASDNFGCSVSISSDGTRFISGAYTADPSSIANAGAAYIFV